MSRWMIAAAALLAPLPAAAAPPTLNYLYPAGAQQGKTVDVSAGGTFERWPVRAWLDRKGVEVKAAKGRGKLAVTVAADAAPGVYWLRLFDEQGASALRPFVVGTLPEVNEQEPNDDAGKPQALASSSVVVNGRLQKPGDVDCFALKLRKGETLVASLDAQRTIGSPMDGVLQVLSADGFVLEENNDDSGPDPLVVLTAKADGTYVVRAFAFPGEPDAGIRFAGAENYVYRLTLTTGGFADHPWPLAVSRAEPGAVEVAGWNIPAEAKALKVTPAPGADTVTLGHARLAGTVSVLIEPHRCLTEVEPNGRNKPQAVALPVTISGRIDPPGDVDVFEFAAKKGERLTFRADARSVGSLLDPVLRLTDAAGKALVRADDSSAGKAGARDAALSFTAPRDGTFRVEVRDLAGHGGPRHFYRLRAGRAEPDYALTVVADRFTLTPGKPLGIPVTVERRNGFDGEIEVSAEGLPDGVTAAPVKSKGAAGKSVTLRLEAKPGAAAGALRVVGRVAGRAELGRSATAAVSPFAPTPHLWLSVATK